MSKLKSVPGRKSSGILENVEEVIPYRKVKRESVKFVMLRCQAKAYPQKMTPLLLYTLVEKQREDEVLELLLKH